MFNGPKGAKFYLPNLLATVKKFRFLAFSSCVVYESPQGYVSVGFAKYHEFLRGKKLGEGGDFISPTFDYL